MAPPPGATGGYTVGYEIRPLMEDGDLDKSNLDGTPAELREDGVKHPAHKDMLYKMAEENKDGGNKLVQDSNFEAAIARYSEAIMQLRSLQDETCVAWDDAGRFQVRTLRSMCYLNLSLCFFKTEQWVHAVNTATRAIQGDMNPPQKDDDVLPPEKKAKALFRRAQANAHGILNTEEATKDLEAALKLTPGDKAIQAELKKVTLGQKILEKDQKQKMSGFLSNSKKAKEGEGIFKEKERPTEEELKAKPQGPKDIVKMTDGLWIAPEQEEAPQPKESEINFDELGQDIDKMKQNDPKLYNELREFVACKVQQAAEEEGLDAVENTPLDAGEVKDVEEKKDVTAAS